MWFALDGDHLYAETGPRTSKLKRIQHTPRVTLAPCTFGGKVTGPLAEGRARIVDDALECARAQALMARMYGLVRRLNY